MSIKIINDFFSWGINSGFFVAIVWFAWAYVKPIMLEKQKHAKTVQERELLALVNQLADNAVNSLVSADAPGHEKFKQATAVVDSALTDKGFDVKRDTINNAVQAAYEKSNLTPTVNPDEKPQTGVVVHD